MSSGCINEGDTILLYCSEASGFLFCQPPSHVTVFPVEDADPLYDPWPPLPSIHFASFQVIPEHADIEYLPLNPQKESPTKFFHSLVYGRKVKLLHVASNKYLSLNSSNTLSLVEKSWCNADSLFRILPAIGKHRGEDVVCGDRIKFQCIRRKKHHLLCSTNVSKIEIIGASTFSTFVIHQTNSAETPYEAVRGGSIVLLFNIEQECHISGMGPVLSDLLPYVLKKKIVSKVGARKGSMQRALSVSGECLWQLEKSKNPLNSNQLQYGDECCIKHLVTQQYLAVTTQNEDHFVSLKKLQPGCRNDPEINFSIVSSKESNGILKGSYVQIRHTATEKNLIVQENTSAILSASTSADDYEFDQRTKPKVCLGNTQQIFILVEVSEDIIHSFYQAQSMVAILTDYFKEKFVAREVYDSLLAGPDWNEPIEALKDLRSWLTLANYNFQNKANILRVLQGVDLLVGFLYEIDLTVKGGAIENKKELCEVICQVLCCYIEKSNKASHLYIADERFLNILFKRIGFGIGAENVLSTLAQTESEVTESVVKRLNTNLEQIQNNLAATTLDFLSTLCFTNGKPIRSLQDNITENIIEAISDSFFCSKIEDGKLIFTHPEKLQGQPVANMADYGDTADDFKFYVAQLKLLSSVCKGLNLDSINKIVYQDKYITVEECLLILNDPHIHQLIQLAYLDFLVSAFLYNVEDSGLGIDNTWHCYKWSDLNYNMDTDQATGALTEHILGGINKEEIEECIENTLQTFFNRCMNEVMEKSVEQIISIVEHLVSYGFFSQHLEKRDIIQKLLTIMERTYNLKVKAKAVKILHIFFKHFCNSTKVKLAYKFKQSKDGGGHIFSKLELLFNDCVYPQKLNAIARQRFLWEKYNFEYVDEERLMHIAYMYDFFGFVDTDGKRFIKVLLDLLKYDDNIIYLNTFKLLFDIYQEDTVFKDAKYSYIIIELDDVRSMIIELGCFCDHDKLLFHMQQGNAIKDEYFDATKDILTRISNACVLASDESVPHKCNQSIVLSSGVLSILLNYVLNFCKVTSSLTLKGERQREILCLATYALIRAVHGNQIIQKQLFKYFTDFLEVKSAVFHVAQLLAEIISNNYDFHELSERDVCQLFEVANTHSTSEYYEFYTSLIILIKTSKTAPLLNKNYQKMISHIIIDHRYELGIMMLKLAYKIRLDILKSRDDNDSQLIQLLSISDLLAVTCENEHTHAQDYCHGIFTIDELISILSNRSIPCERKKPFASLLCSAYLLTEKNLLVSLEKLMRSQPFWDHVKECGTLINAMNETIEESDKEQLRIKVKLLLNQFISIPAWRCLNQNFLETMVTYDSADHPRHDVPLTSILLYVIDGLVPLLSAFCNQLMCHCNTDNELLTSEIKESLTTVGSNLAKLILNQQSIFLSTPSHATAWLKFLKIIISLTEATSQSHIMVQELYNQLSLVSPIFTSQAEIEYLTQFEEEIKLNREFHLFIDQTEEAYKSQVPSKANENDDILPKDECFKKLVARFGDTIKYESIENKPVAHLLKFLLIVYDQLQQPLTRQRRQEFNILVAKCLQILSGIIFVRIDTLVSPKHKTPAQFAEANPAVFAKKYKADVKPVQDTLVTLDINNKANAIFIAMLHFSHPDHEVAVQMLGFLVAILYCGNENAQNDIYHLCSHKDTNFIQKIYKMLDTVISNVSHTDVKTHHSTLKQSLTKQTSPEAPAAQVAIEMEATSLSNLLDMIDGGDEENNDNDLQIKLITEKPSRYPQQESREAVKRDASVVLDTISSLCNGQNHKMQDILRIQTFSHSSINIVGQVAVLLQNLTEDMRKENLSIVLKTIWALIEMCSGNYLNQEIVFKGQIIDCINHILNILVEDEELSASRQVAMLLSSCIQLLQVMLEDIDERSSKLACEISKELHVQSLLVGIKTLYTCQNVDKNMCTRGMVKGYHVLKTLADHLNITVDEYVPQQARFEVDFSQVLWDDLEYRTRSIEIKYWGISATDLTKKADSGILTTVYFQFDPAKQLTEEQKEIVKLNINRESPKDKVKDLLQWTEAIRRKVNHENKIKKMWLRWIFWFSNLRNSILIILTLLLNAFVLFLFKIPNRERNLNDTDILFVGEPATPYWFHGLVLVFIGGIHLVLSLWMVLEYFIQEWPNIIWTIPSIHNALSSFKMSVYYRGNLKQCLDSIGNKIPAFMEYSEETNYLKIYFFSYAPLYRIFFLLCSIAALGTRGYFYCGCILYVMHENKVLHTVLTAMRRSAYQLFSVLLLGLAILLFYTVISFLILSEFFDPDDDGTYAYCSTLIECYISVIREGLLDTFGTGISHQYVGQPGPNFTVYWLRTVFDVSFFIIVTTLGLNVVIAILVDSFSQLRSEVDEVRKDSHNYCFICGIDNETFERCAKGFKDHVVNDHSMWNYIYFFLYIHSMSPNDHIAMEKYVYDSIKDKENQQTDFFPLNEAKVLPNYRHEE